MGTPAGVTKGVGVGIPRWSEFLKKITECNILGTLFGTYLAGRHLLLLISSGCLWFLCWYNPAEVLYPLLHPETRQRNRRAEPSLPFNVDALPRGVMSSGCFALLCWCSPMRAE